MNYFGNFGAECHLLKIGCSSLVSPNISRFTIFYHILFSHDDEHLSYERSVNYFGNFGAECYLLKIGCNEFSFIKHRGFQCNLSYII